MSQPKAEIFLIFSNFIKSLSESLCKSWNNWHTKFVILDVKFRFTWVESDLCWNIVKFQIIMTRALASLFGKLTLKVLRFLGQALSFILSRYPNHSTLSFWKHSFMPFNFSLVLSFSVEILSSGLTFKIHLITIFASLSSTLITSSSLTGQVSLFYTNYTHMQNTIYVLLLRVNL